jgi:hypothetical protein
VKIAGKRMGSTKAVKDAAKRSTAGAQWIKNIPSDGITVRFLTEPEDWFGYMRYWSDEASSYVPMLEGEKAPDGARVQFRFVANALDVDQDRVVPLDIPKTLSTDLMVLFDKFDSLMDRDYELLRSGEGLDTSYTVIPDAKSSRKLSAYERIELDEFLIKIRENALNPLKDDADDGVGFDKVPVSSDEDEDEELDEEEEFDSEEDEDDDSEEDEDEDEDEDEPYTKSELTAMSAADLRDLAEEWELETIPRSKSALIDAILAAQDEDEDEEDEEEDDEESFDEDTLNAMSIRELRSIAEDFDVDTDGVKKADLVEAILEAAD